MGADLVCERDPGVTLKAMRPPTLRGSHKHPLWHTLVEEVGNEDKKQ